MAGVEVSLRAARERERESERERKRGRERKSGRDRKGFHPRFAAVAIASSGWWSRCGGRRGMAGHRRVLAPLLPRARPAAAQVRGAGSCRLRFAVHAGWRGGAEECICCVVGRRVRLSVAVGGWREDLTRARPVGAGQREARTHAVSLCGCGVGGRERKKCARGRGGGAEERRPRERGRGRVRWLASGLCPCPCFGRFGVCGVVGVCEFSWEGCVCVFRAGMRQGEGKSEESSVGRE